MNSTESWVWCRKCQRCTRWHDNPQPPRNSRCKGGTCKAPPGTLIRWEHVRRFHPELPVVPIEHKLYRLALWLWCPSCKHVFDAARYGKRCPVPVCRAGPDTRFIIWRAVRADHPLYPERPEPDQVYWFNTHPNDPTPAIRRYRTSESTFLARRDSPRAFEVVCARCETINNQTQRSARCFYCEELLPVPKKPGRDLPRDLRSSHWSNYPFIIGPSDDLDGG
jgi:hypothetical protein